MNALPKLGYTWVSLPSADIEPLQLLERTGPGQVQQLNAELTDMFEPNTYPAPLVQPGKALPPELSGEDTVDFSVEANFSLLESLVKIFTGKAGLHLNVDRKRAAKFKLNQATRSVVNMIKLDAYLQDAQVNAAARNYVSKLKGDGLFIITEVIKAPSFTISLERSTGTDAGLEAPTNVADVNAGFDRNTGQLKVMTAQGDVPLTVAVRAARIYFDKPGFLSGKPGKFRMSADENINTFRGEEDFPAEWLPDAATALGKAE